ncbi:MAG: hypothetical protein AVDCRST_MAG76-938, partial [uncultured Acidimicrobiales bacterium]
PPGVPAPLALPEAHPPPGQPGRGRAHVRHGAQRLVPPGPPGGEGACRRADRGARATRRTLHPRLLPGPRRPSPRRPHPSLAGRGRPVPVEPVAVEPAGRHPQARHATIAGL